MSKAPFALAFIVFLSPCFSFAAKQVKKIEISKKEKKASPVDPYQTFKVEKLSHGKFKNPVRQNLSDLMQDQAGVESQSYCSNCGAKRLTINGLKGEHTSILVDGISLHSAVSSFYGVDSIPVNGIAEIEVMRGAGASLSHPESIGGTVNIITMSPMQDHQDYQSSVTFNDSLNLSQQNHALLYSKAYDKYGILAGLQYAELQSWDEDQNNIAESPERKNISALFKTKALLGKSTEVDLRLSFSNLNILGGPVDAQKPKEVRPVPAGPNDFEDVGNAESRYIGDPIRVTDWIALRRYEVSSHLKSTLSGRSRLNVLAGFARQEQDSIYQHGFDYANRDHIFSLNSYVDYNLKKHLLKFGVYSKVETLRASSEFLFNLKGYEADDFDQYNVALYAQSTSFFKGGLELDMALRLDHISMDWLELDNNIKKWLLAPRLQLKKSYNSHLSQRLSYGLGYRSPLTFFESQHGNNENGYAIDIDKIELAHSVVHSLSYNTPKYYLTSGVHYTRLNNMAYGVESGTGRIDYINSKEAFDIWATDLLLGYKWNDKLMFESTLEAFFYDKLYKKRLPTAAVEKRVQFRANYNSKKWNFNTQLNWVFARDLSDYGQYENHYTRYRQLPTLTFANLKRQKSPNFATLDIRAGYNFSKKLSLTLGVSNLFDTTQVSLGDSPSTWHKHNGHAHYDGLHTWGPNRGREYFVRLQMEI